MNCIDGIVLGVTFILASMFAGDAKEWTNPEGSVSVSMGFDASGLQHLYLNGEELPLVAHSPVRRENHGFGWQEGAEQDWIDNRFLILEDEAGLCIVDSETRKILINQTFTGISKSPGSAKWVAIRYRPVGRKQEKLESGWKDTVWFIEPETLARKVSEVSEEKPLKHIAAKPLNGIALSKPVWSEVDWTVTIATSVNGKIVMAKFDTKTRQLVSERPLEGVELSEEQMVSPWFLPEVDALTCCGRFASKQ